MSDDPNGAPFYLSVLVKVEGTPQMASFVLAQSKGHALRELVPGVLAYGIGADASTAVAQAQPGTITRWAVYGACPVRFPLGTTTALPCPSCGEHAGRHESL